MGHGHLGGWGNGSWIMSGPPACQLTAQSNREALAGGSYTRSIDSRGKNSSQCECPDDSLFPNSEIVRTFVTNYSRRCRGPCAPSARTDGGAGAHVDPYR